MTWGEIDQPPKHISIEDGVQLSDAETIVEIRGLIATFRSAYEWDGSLESLARAFLGEHYLGMDPIQLAKSFFQVQTMVRPGYIGTKGSV